MYEDEEEHTLVDLRNAQRRDIRDEEVVRMC